MSSIPHRIASIGDVVISSVSGSVVHNAPVSHMHADDSLLHDLKELKSSLVADDLLQFDGTNLTARPLSDFALSGDLSGKLDVSQFETFRDTTAPSTYATLTQKEDLETQISGKVSQTDFDDLETVVNGKLSSVDASTTYATLTQLSTLETEVDGKIDLSLADASYASLAQLTTLQGEVDLKALQSDHVALESVVNGKISASEQYIQDVGSNLSVSANVLSVDLSSKLSVADLGSEWSALNEASINYLSVGSKKYSCTTHTYSNTLTAKYNVSLTANKVYLVKVDAVYRSSTFGSFGAVSYRAMWKRESNTASLINSSDSALLSGACDGSELVLSNSSGNVSVSVQGSAGVTDDGSCSISVEVQEC